MSKELIRQIDEMIEDRQIILEAKQEEVVKSLFSEYKELFMNMSLAVSNIQSTGSITNITTDKVLGEVLKNLTKIRKITKASETKAGALTSFNLNADLGTIAATLKNTANKIDVIIEKKLDLASDVEIPVEDDVESAEFADEEQIPVKEEEKPKRRRKIF